jgi:hypothetical protein
MPYNTPGVQEEDIWRIPLVGAPNTRPRDDSQALDQRFTNCIMDVVDNPITGGKKYYISKRPGFAVDSTPAAGSVGCAIKVCTSYTAAQVVSAFGASNSTIYTNGTSLGSITGKCSFIEETVIGSTVYAFILSGDNTAWYYVFGSGTGTQTVTGDTTNTLPTVTNVSSTTNLYSGMAVTGTGIPAGTRILTVDSATQFTMTANATATNAGITITRELLAKVIDADFPGNNSRTLRGRPVFLDGYCFVMDDTGRIYGSAIDSITSWDGSYISAQGYPDKGMGLIRYKNGIVAFGKESIEFFRNAGNETGSPLERVQDNIYHIGCITVNANCTVDDTIAWVGNSSIAGVSVYMMDGFTPKKISTPAIEENLVNGSGGFVYASVVRMVGRTFLLITNSTENNTYAYCIENQTWTEWKSDVAGLVLWHFTSGGGSPTLFSQQTYAVSATSTGGKVYYHNPQTPGYIDDVTNYTMTIQTSKIDGDNNFLKRLTKLFLIGDAISGGYSVSVSWSDDDYATFSTARTLDLSTSVNYLMACGAFRRRAFKISSTAPDKIRLEALELHIKQGQH